MDNDVINYKQLYDDLLKKYNKLKEKIKLLKNSYDNCKSNRQREQYKCDSGHCDECEYYYKFN